MWFASNNLCDGPIATPGAFSAPPPVSPHSPTVLPLWSSAAALILEAMLCPGISRLQIPESSVFDGTGPAHTDLGPPAATTATPLSPPPPQGTTRGNLSYPHEWRQAGGRHYPRQWRPCHRAIAGTGNSPTEVVMQEV